MTRRRLDVELVARGLARSRRQARELVDSSTVEVAGQPTTKPSQPVDEDTPIRLTAEPDRWVGRAALKLLHALERWGESSGTPEPIVVRGARCLDVGASTGGFTHVLLEQGAAHVTALDVGHGQLVAALADDPRVRDLPGTNIRHAGSADLGSPFELVVADLSFISLTIALPSMLALTSGEADLVVLVKPQFEVGREHLGHKGVVRSPEDHLRVLRTIGQVAEGLGLRVRGVAASPILGGEGNREFLLWLTRGTSPDLPATPDDAMLEAVRGSGDAARLDDREAHP